MKEVKGLEDRLSGLEQLMHGARKIVDEQVEMAQVCSHTHTHRHRHSCLAAIRMKNISANIELFVHMISYNMCKCVSVCVSGVQGFVQNQARARNLQDVSVLPDLCTSHRRQLSLMLKNHQSLQDIHRRCAAAKDELSANLHARLRSVCLPVCLSVCR